eukprot:CAMPEP_0172722062 /NCGR_PEP_ID=MMETSP1074-20121228/80568_1 /TAXON_ID=2916 /ORGANISM="Ceratium fusus, Strain PA161109" /LENGTH=204 /DNA_ID=CAMNT_0013547973 /DNA_START=64 /DNA_END=678 /DNA_ORIENTATION=+
MKTEQMLWIAICVIFALAVGEAFSLLFVEDVSDKTASYLFGRFINQCWDEGDWGSDRYKECVLIYAGRLHRFKANCFSLAMVAGSLYVGVLGMQQRNRFLLRLFCCCNGAGVVWFSGMWVATIMAVANPRERVGRVGSLTVAAILWCGMAAARLVATASSVQMLDEDLESPQPQSGSARTPNIEMTQQRALTTGEMAQPMHWNS